MWLRLCVCGGQSHNGGGALQEAYYVDNEFQGIY